MKRIGYGNYAVFLMSIFTSIWVSLHIFILMFYFQYVALMPVFMFYIILIQLQTICDSTMNGRVNEVEINLRLIKLEKWAIIEAIVADFQ